MELFICIYIYIYIYIYIFFFFFLIRQLLLRLNTKYSESINKLRIRLIDTLGSYSGWARLHRYVLK